MNVLTASWRGLVEVVAMGLRLLARHWPQLLALYLAGAAGRGLFLWLTLWASKFSSFLALLILPLAPLCLLLALVVMLRVCADSLPFLPGTQQENNPDTRWKSNLRIAVQTLVPFVAVYASQKLLSEDARFFIYTATAEESRNHFLNANFSRVVYASGWTLAALILGAIALRKWISVRKLAERTVFWGLIAGYVETLWLVTFSSALTSQLANVREWVLSREVIGHALEWEKQASAAPNTAIINVTKAVNTAGEFLSSLGNLVVVPVAWLAVGALIYGSTLAARELPVNEKVSRHLRRVPGPLQQLLSQFFEPVTTPLKNTWQAISKVAAGGLLSMVLFCVTFALSGALLKTGLAFLTRLVVGPHSIQWQEAALPYVLLVERGLYLIVSVVLIAAAVNRVIRLREQNLVESTSAQTLDSETYGPVPGSRSSA